MRPEEAEPKVGQVFDIQPPPWTMSHISVADVGMPNLGKFPQRAVQDLCASHAPCMGPCRW